MLALVLAMLASQDWTYRDGVFVHSETRQEKSAEDLLLHAVELRKKGCPNRAGRTIDLILKHAPKRDLLEELIYERAVTLMAAGRLYKAHRQGNAFLLRFPQSERVVAIRRLLMESALQLAKKGHPQTFLGITIHYSSSTGVKLLREALRRFPREDFTPDYYQRLGKFFYDRGELNDAENEFTLVLEQYTGAREWVLALYMLAMTIEQRFDALNYDIKPLHDARRHYERFLEEADRMRKLPAPAAQWVDELLPVVQQHRAKIHELMAGKELETAEYYDWKGLPQSSLVAYRGILNHTSCCRGFRTRDLPETEAARKARARVKEMTMPGRQSAVPEETEP